jgi:hypothetical protein
MIELHYIPQYRIMDMNINKKIMMIMDLAKENKIIIIEGRLKPKEEAMLLRETMSRIGEDITFKGIEIGSLYSTGQNITTFGERIRKLFVSKSNGLTVIGPARIVREIKQDPQSLVMYIQKDFQKV